jgi:hypothetical protein
MALFVRNALEALRALGHYERKRAIISVIMKIASYYPLNKR